MPNTSLPDAVVVSMAAPSPVRTLRPIATVGKVVDGVHEVAQVAAEPVEFPDEESVAFPECFQARRQVWAVVFLPGCLILIKMIDFDPGG